jgi:hypothetical protein
MATEKKPIMGSGAVSKERQARAALDGPLKHFIGGRQRQAVVTLFRCEEKEYFFDKMIELAAIVEQMPFTYGQDGLGDQATVYLHYFAGGAANWWITEKDKGSPLDDPADQGKQLQAFGLANFYGGPNDPEAELGYISIEEILANGGELDFHFTPCTLATVKERGR